MRTLRVQKGKCRMLMLGCSSLLIWATAWGSASITVRAEGVGIVDSIKDGGARLWQKTKEKVPEIKDKVVEKAPEVKEKAEEAYDDASEAISNYREQSEDEFWDWFDGQTNGNGPQREAKETISQNERIEESDADAVGLETVSANELDTAVEDGEDQTLSVDDEDRTLSEDVAIPPIIPSDDPERVDSSEISLNESSSGTEQQKPGDAWTDEALATGWFPEEKPALFESKMEKFMACAAFVIVVWLIVIISVLVVVSRTDRLSVASATDDAGDTDRDVSRADGVDNDCGNADEPEDDP